MSNGAKPSESPACIAPQKVEAKGLEEKIREKAPEVLDAIPVANRPKLFRVIEEVSIRSGPLPDPRELAAYNEIIPDGADRIMKMAEAQNAHRIKIETTVVESQQSQSSRGQWFGLIIGLSGLGLATYAAISGQPWFGGTIGGATLVSLVAGFLSSKDSQKADLRAKRTQMPPPQSVPETKDKRQKNKNR